MWPDVWDCRISRYCAPLPPTSLRLIVIEDTGAVWPARLVGRQRRPTCVLVGADPGYGEPDPALSEWRCARQLKYWCRAVTVHGTAGERDHYRAAVTATISAGRLAFIETTSRRAREWGAFLGCPRTLLIVPFGGAVHPAQSRPEAIQ